MIPHCSVLPPPVCHRVSHLTGDYSVPEAREAGLKEISVSLNKHAAHLERVSHRTSRLFWDGTTKLHYGFVDRLARSSCPAGLLHPLFLPWGTA